MYTHICDILELNGRLRKSNLSRFSQTESVDCGTHPVTFDVHRNYRVVEKMRLDRHRSNEICFSPKPLESRSKLRPFVPQTLLESGCQTHLVRKGQIKALDAH